MCCTCMATGPPVNAHNQECYEDLAGPQYWLPWTFESPLPPEERGVFLHMFKMFVNHVFSANDSEGYNGSERGTLTETSPHGSSSTLSFKVSVHGNRCHTFSGQDGPNNMLDDTMILPPSNVRHQALATACSITNSHGYATDHAVLTCDIDLATAGLEVPTQPSFLARRTLARPAGGSRPWWNKHHNTG
jgi:hypothetical protein